MENQFKILGLCYGLLVKLSYRIGKNEIEKDKDIEIGIEIRIDFSLGMDSERDRWKIRRANLWVLKSWSASEEG